MSDVQPVVVGSLLRSVNGVPMLAQENVGDLFTAAGQVPVGVGAGEGVFGHPAEPVFSWPGPVATGTASGPYLILLEELAALLVVTVSVGTPDGGNDITMTYLLNGSSFTTLVLPAGASSAYLRNDGSWPTCGANTTDNLQVQITTYAGSTAADLVASIRLV